MKPFLAADPIIKAPLGNELWMVALGPCRCDCRCRLRCFAVVIATATTSNGAPVWAHLEQTVLFLATCCDNAVKGAFNAVSYHGLIAVIAIAIALIVFV